MDIVNRLYDEILNLDIPLAEKREVIRELLEALELWAGNDEALEGYSETSNLDAPYHRTVYRVEVLSDSPIPSGMDLDYINYQITDGDWSGTVEEVVNGHISRSSMIRLLSEQGSDPAFLVSDYNPEED